MKSRSVTTILSKAIGRAAASAWRLEQPSTVDAPAADRVSPPMRFPVGHYYSPMYDTRELAEQRQMLWPSVPRETVGLDWREAHQLALCHNVFARQTRLSFQDDGVEGSTEYFVSNGQFPPLDAWILEGFIRHYKPKHMIEVGCGFSTLISTQVNREYFDSQINLTCIEPYPRPFLSNGVAGMTGLRVEKIQEVPLALFDLLKEDDILFIDTSHTVKTGGDVTWIFHEILPRLTPGVVVHIHDFFLPGEYPELWVMEGWGWNDLLGTVIPDIQRCLRDSLGCAVHAYPSPR